MARPSSADVARRVRDAVLGVDGVVDLDTGALGTFVTYGPGGRVGGVTVHDDGDVRAVAVHVAAAWGIPLPAVGDAAVEAALATLDATWPDGAWRVDVEISDLATADRATQADAGVAAEAPMGGRALPPGPLPAALPAGPVPDAVPVDLGGAGSTTVPASTRARAETGADA